MKLRLKQFRTCLLVILATSSLTGCSEEADSRDAVVQGNVTVDGELATSGAVMFHPIADGPIATGQIHGDGSYSLRIGLGNYGDADKSKIFSGDYVATVLVNAPADRSQTINEGGPPVGGPRLTALKYAKKETSGLAFSVKPGRNVFPLAVEGSDSDPPVEVVLEETEQTDETLTADQSGLAESEAGSPGEEEESGDPAEADEVNSEDKSGQESVEGSLE